jgi:hypothetical protein
MQRLCSGQMSWQALLYFGNAAHLASLSKNYPFPPHARATQTWIWSYLLGLQGFLKLQFAYEVKLSEIHQLLLACDLLPVALQMWITLLRETGQVHCTMSVVLCTFQNHCRYAYILTFTIEHVFSVGID